MKTNVALYFGALRKLRLILSVIGDWLFSFINTISVDMLWEKERERKTFCIAVTFEKKLLTATAFVEGNFRMRRRSRRSRATGVA
jgi:hypothetical protein